MKGVLDARSVITLVTPQRTEKAPVRVHGAANQGIKTEIVSRNLKRMIGPDPS